MKTVSARVDENLSPGLVQWEAWREQGPGVRWRDDLSTMEAMRLMNEVRCFGRIAFLLLGRPLRRADVGVLVEHGARIGLSMRLAPGADLLTPEQATDLRDAGLMRVVLESSLRSPATLQEEITAARAVGLGVHVMTAATPALLDSLVETAETYARAGVHVWQLSFGDEWAEDPAALDPVLKRLLALADALPLQLEVAGAPQLQRLLPASAPETVVTAPSEGYTLLYVGVDGAVQPSARLPIPLGNVRHEDVVDVFRDAREMCALRNPDQLHGKCAACEFRYLCGGGNRARAFAVTGNWLAPDPACGYQPRRSS